MQGEMEDDVFARAKAYSGNLLEKCRSFFEARIAELKLDPAAICVAATGSVGRREALEASDLDPIVISKLPQTPKGCAAEQTDLLYKRLTEGLSIYLGIDVSEGRSVMGAVALDDLADPDRIGGDKDDRIALTRRTLVLTESANAGGALSLREVRRQILEAYSPIEDYYHPLPLCNDVVRYYRQLCIDYNQKHKTADREWAEKNVKLRHSRKFWYFTTGLAIVAAVLSSRREGDAPRWRMVDAHDRLLDVLERPTYERLSLLLDNDAALRRELLAKYAAYLRWMSSRETRQSLLAVPREQRAGDPVFATLRENSERLHDLMMRYVKEVNDDVQSKFLDWFLL